MNYKEFNVKYSDEGNGSIEGYASTWIRTPDSYGDVVKQGAFTNTLKERWNGGKGIPLLWAHQMDNINSYIGKADAEEDDKGLHFLAQFDATEEAQRVRDLYKDGRLRKFSFAFDVLDQGPAADIKANELRELDLFEISCVCVPANDDAGVVAVKSSDTEEKENIVEEKSGRRNSRKDADIINQIITLAKSLLDDEVDEADEPKDGEDEVKANGAPEEPEQSNPKKERLLAYINSIHEEDEE